MRTLTIRRSSDYADRDRFLRDLVAAFDDLGVPRGGTFVVTAPGAATGDPRDVVDGPARSGDTARRRALGALERRNRARAVVLALLAVCARLEALEHTIDRRLDELADDAFRQAGR